VLAAAMLHPQAVAVHQYQLRGLSPSTSTRLCTAKWHRKLLQQLAAAAVALAWVQQQLWTPLLLMPSLQPLAQQKPP